MHELSNCESVEMIDFNRDEVPELVDVPLDEVSGTCDASTAAGAGAHSRAHGMVSYRFFAGSTPTMGVPSGSTKGHVSAPKKAGLAVR